MRSQVLEFMFELISRSLILDQCPAWDDPRGWPDLSQPDPFARMESAACKRYAFLTQHNLPRTQKGYLGLPVPIRACLDNCYFRAAIYLLSSRACWYYLGNVYYRRTLCMSVKDGDGRHLERIICIYMRWWECHYVLKLCRLHEMGCRMGTDHLKIDESELGPLTPSEIGDTDGIFRCVQYPPDHCWPNNPNHGHYQTLPLLFWDRWQGAP